VGEREARNAALAALVSRTGAELVQRVGNVGVFYRRRKQLPTILIPD
jgi:RNA-binding protein YhbY